MKDNVRYIADRWITKERDYIAIRCKGRWIHYRKVGLDSQNFNLLNFKQQIALAGFSKEELQDIINTCQQLSFSLLTSEEKEIYR